MADTLTTIQAQITAQLGAINQTLAKSSLDATVKTDLVNSQSTLQSLLNKLVGGDSLSASDQTALSASLDTSQKAILAQQAQQTQTLLFGLTGILMVGIGIFFIVRSQRKK